MKKEIKELGLKEWEEKIIDGTFKKIPTSIYPNVWEITFKREIVTGTQLEVITRKLGEIVSMRVSEGKLSLLFIRKIEGGN